jgi:hypothetical protein
MMARKKICAILSLGLRIITTAPIMKLAKPMIRYIMRNVARA